jgi:GH24 family phage-related lysozyme (muramidase)
MNIGYTRDYIERWEDRRSRVYKDSRGHPTIGVGFNLDRNDARNKVETLGLDYDKVRSGAIELTDDQINELFFPDVDAAIDAASEAIANFDDLSDEKQTVLVDMVFNLGAAGFRAFRRMIAAVEAEDWETAASEMENSAWYGQVGPRARAAVKAMREDP